MSHEKLISQMTTALQFNAEVLSGGNLSVHTPIDGSIIAQVQTHTPDEIDAMFARAQHAFYQWRVIPAPQRGELVRLFGEELRTHKEVLAQLVTLECGKIYQEGLGEVQEMIDICDFAVGLSRQLYGLTIASERAHHRMAETWHPLGTVGIISAFNFPVAVWAWNAAIALVCGDSVLWKPSEKTPLCALFCQHLLKRVAGTMHNAPDDLSQVIIGDRVAGEQLVGDQRIPLISATGSTAMGRKIAPTVAARFGRSILELGGNNAIIVRQSADLAMAVRAILFGAVGTAGQRCTTTRRLLVQDSVYDSLVSTLKKSYQNIIVGDPMDKKTHIGPLIDEDAYQRMHNALKDCKAPFIGGERIQQDTYPNAYYVTPTIVEMPQGSPMGCEEIFAPILFIYRHHSLDEAIAQQNSVPQGLSSAIFTGDVREAETFLSVVGSDCGIANVNIGTSGAEIGGAFGGEKATGGGRESGSDSWKMYMRRQTATINYSSELPLAQGIQFNLS